MEQRTINANPKMKVCEVCKQCKNTCKYKFSVKIESFHCKRYEKKK